MCYYSSWDKLTERNCDNYITRNIMVYTHHLTCIMELRQVIRVYTWRKCTIFWLGDQVKKTIGHTNNAELVACFITELHWTNFLSAIITNVTSWCSSAIRIPVWIHSNIVTLSEMSNIAPHRRHHSTELMTQNDGHFTAGICTLQCRDKVGLFPGDGAARHQHLKDKFVPCFVESDIWHNETLCNQKCVKFTENTDGR
jgi:hypothetical protein